MNRGFTKNDYDNIVYVELVFLAQHIIYNYYRLHI